ncbi:hypothetical protein [Nocardia sp. NPDC004860]|uniref:hypothetical protein n=1 Tax=Nocardia sp. NPDC004860 TaxID=3154557 RepID=UPI0033B2DBAB
MTQDRDNGGLGFGPAVTTGLFLVIVALVTYPDDLQDRCRASAAGSPTGPRTLDSI